MPTGESELSPPPRVEARGPESPVGGTSDVAVPPSTIAPTSASEHPYLDYDVLPPPRAVRPMPPPLTQLPDSSAYLGITERTPKTLTEMAAVAAGIEGALRATRAGGAVLSLLQSAGLWPEDMRALFEALQLAGEEVITDFARRAVKDWRLSAYLEQLGVSRQTILVHYRPDYRDQVEFLAGYFFGVAKGFFVDPLLALKDLPGLAVQIQQLQSLALKAIVDPEARALLGEILGSVRREFSVLWDKGLLGLGQEGLDHLYDLLQDGRYFEAGTEVGNVVGVAGDLAGLAKALSTAMLKASKKLNVMERILGGLKKLDLNGLLNRFDRSTTEDIVRHIREGREWLSPDGTLRVRPYGQKRLIVLDGNGRPLREMENPIDDTTDLDKFLDDALRDDALKSPQDVSADDVARAQADLEGRYPESIGASGKPLDAQRLVQTVAEDMLKDPQWVGAFEKDKAGFGRELHERMRRLLDSYGLPADRVILDGQPIRNLLDPARLPADPPTVLDFLRSLKDPETGRLPTEAKSALEELLRAAAKENDPEGQISRFLESRIDQIKPDFALIDETNVLHVLDWTRNDRVPHLVKTQIYSEILRHYGKSDVKMVRVGEILYEDLKRLTRTRRAGKGEGAMKDLYRKNLTKTLQEWYRHAEQKRYPTLLSPEELKLPPFERERRLKQRIIEQTRKMKKGRVVE
ncbi:MAG TPA: hypothetical protein VNP04_32465 [Alphaproteobacteria bacterium]|nr:hypothetical protein [Alphaproteobacteria bacterium]